MTDNITLPRSVVEQSLNWAIKHGEKVYAAGGFESLDSMNAWAEALRAALEQPQVEQEPAAYCVASGASPFQIFRSKSQADSLAYDLQKRHDLAGSPAHFHVIPLYAHPQNLNCKSTQARLATLWGYEKPQPPRQPLTDEEINNMDVWLRDTPFWRILKLVRAIERAHKIGGEA